MAVPTPQVYEAELRHLQTEAARFNDFTEFSERFDSPSDDFLTALRSLHSANSPHILDAERLKKLKIDHPDLYSQIYPAYLSFLQEKAGISNSA